MNSSSYVGKNDVRIEISRYRSRGAWCRCDHHAGRLHRQFGIPGNGSDSGMNGSSQSGNGVMGGSKSSAFSATDVMFAQMMIPHHQQAVDMSDLALTKSTNPEVIALARQIRNAREPEITLMNEWLRSAGAPAAMGNNADDMAMGAGGILSDDEMTALKNVPSSVGVQVGCE